MERAEALAALVSTARVYLIHRSRTPSVRQPKPTIRILVATKALARSVAEISTGIRPPLTTGLEAPEDAHDLEY